MKIHRIKTGRVKVKLNQISKANRMATKLTKVFFDKHWSEWLPIYAWLIEHDEGFFLVDTGETHKTGVNGYLPKWHPYYTMAVQFDVKPEEEIGPQLSNMGIAPKNDVRKVIMTHLHTDHAGGMHHFPNSEFLIEKEEFNSASGLTGIMAGYLPHRWPKWLNPTLVSLTNQAFGPFEKSLSITDDGSVTIVATPGHVATHMSVIVKIEGIYYFLAGDASYTERNMIEGIPDGVGTNDSEDTLVRIQEFTKKYPTVYLPSHDTESANRMDNQIIVPLYEKEYEYSS